MRFERTDFAGLVLIHPGRREDERGHFSRVFDAALFERQGLATAFVQWSTSHNRRAGTLRGLHFQKPPHAEAKLVRCTRGAVFDVAVDLRPQEASFGRWIGFVLSAANGLSLHIPAGFAHGFQTLEDESELAYAITPAFVPDAGAGLRWDDPALAIAWPRPVAVISAKDRAWPDLAGALA